VILFVDFETRSRADLKTIGGRRYAEHESTEALCAVIVRETPAGDEWQEWRPGYAPRIGAAGTFDAVAHNAIGFDRHIWRRLGWPEPRRWIDTAELARVAGFPEASLEWLGANLLRAPKDLEGRKLTKSLSAVSRARKKAGQYRVDLTPEVLARVIAYCRVDVEIMVRLYREWLAPWEGSDLEGLEATDRAVIDRGVAFDRDLAELLLLADETLRDQALEAAGVVDTAELAPARLRNTLATLGATVDDCTADTIEELKAEAARYLEDPLNDPAEAADLRRIVALCTARQALSSIAAGKLRAGLARCSSDGRLRDNTRYYGAHTGRWSGSGMQLQNMAAGASIDVDATIKLLNEGRLEAVYL
jgi:DNA polymerase